MANYPDTAAKMRYKVVDADGAVIGHFAESTYDGKLRRRLAGILQRIKYKPGWSFEVGSPWSSGITVIASTGQLGDARDPTKVLRMGLALSRPITWQALDELEDTAIAKFVFDTVREIEYHEAQEWFRLDDVIVDDPHK